jgi:hypothetical protein
LTVRDAVQQGPERALAFYKYVIFTDKNLATLTHIVMISILNKLKSLFVAAMMIHFLIGVALTSCSSSDKGSESSEEHPESAEGEEHPTDGEEHPSDSEDEEHPEEEEEGEE